MEIKEEKKVIEQIVFTYISNDGTPFTNQRECEDYEKSLSQKELEQRLNSIKQINYTPPTADTDHNYVWFYIANQEEEETIESYYNNLGEYNDIEIDIDSYPAWYGIEEGYGCDAWIVGTLERYKNNVKVMMDRIEQSLKL